MAVIKLDEIKVESGVNSLFGLLKNVPDKSSKNLLLQAEPIFLQIEFVKIPKIRRIIARIPLDHSLYSDTSEVCLIVADLIRGRKVNHEMTVNHYNKLLKKRGITDVQKVVPSRQIRVEYTQYEARRKFCHMYDVFLIDNKISSYLMPKLGNTFDKARKWPIPIRIKRKDLKSEILSKLKKTSMALDGRGPVKTVQVGHADMTAEQIVQNIMSVSRYITKNFPGGWCNVRSLHLKGIKSAAIPIYVSLISSNDVPNPVLRGKKRKSVLAIDELSSIGKKIAVYRSGKVKILKDECSSSDDNDDDFEDEDISNENEETNGVEKLRRRKLKRNHPQMNDDDDSALETKKKDEHLNDENNLDDDDEENKVEDSAETNYLYHMQMEEMMKEEEEKSKENEVKQNSSNDQPIKKAGSAKKQLKKSKKSKIKA